MGLPCQPGGREEGTVRHEAPRSLGTVLEQTSSTGRATWEGAQLYPRILPWQDTPWAAVARPGAVAAYGARLSRPSSLQSSQPTTSRTPRGRLAPLLAAGHLTHAPPKLLCTLALLGGPTPQVCKGAAKVNSSLPSFWSRLFSAT